MPSALDATEKAAFALLSAGGDIGAPVYQHVPEDSATPVIIIGDLTSAPLDAKDDADRRIAMTIVTVVEGEERKPLLELQDAIEQRIAGIRTVQDGWRLSFTFAGASAVLAPEGDAYVGESRFDVIALT